MLKVSWPKTLKKWFNVKNKAEDFHADAFSHEERSTKKHAPPHVREVNDYRIFVATWNVAGKSPTGSLNLEDWLHTPPPADIYVLGFQEIVPLNAGNVLGTEDNGPAKKWLALIRRTLNSLPGTSYDPNLELDSDFEELKTVKNTSFMSRSMRITKSDMAMSQPRLERGYSGSDRIVYRNRVNGYGLNLGDSDEDNEPDGLRLPDSIRDPETEYCESMSGKNPKNSRYCLVASKQMVGIYLTIWIKSDLRDNVRNMKVSCVGRGLMGYLGNKGSISISMTLHQTSFCFICCHLTSGQKEGDELRRNADVMEILRKTWFPRVQGTRDEKSPQTILDHDRIIWLGDLNYRIALSYRSAKDLVEARNWGALLANDQLRIEQRSGRVFNGWNEGRIYFPPTYKYSNNSDRYACNDMHPKEKKRTPAWCDRILWYGRGLHQMSYVRGESRFSDHRPVYSIFIAEVESINRCKIKKNTSCSSRIEVEELLPYLH
ncbi:putative endonuclease/exonuclease/phosphatase [Helianthus annuus]|nr:putative endonuclease/exonuclease/phosphatase [Helianthus annuus]KAJ0597384.1 putative endonuclease/exonuclease/phosphatase [Helianthus annuus]KAJ0758045.1 putative endonuclease/exonuclease/phosphatase [Helianthus annuus]